MTRLIDNLVNLQGFIKDSQLAEYLDGKNLSAPASWTTKADVETRTAYHATRTRESADRVKANEAVKRSYRLKSKR